MLRSAVLPFYPSFGSGLRRTGSDSSIKQIVAKCNYLDDNKCQKLYATDRLNISYIQLRCFEIKVKHLIKLLFFVKKRKNVYICLAVFVQNQDPLASSRLRSLCVPISLFINYHNILRENKRVEIRIPIFQGVVSGFSLVCDGCKRIRSISTRILTLIFKEER